jgi:hypothetical protein
MSLTNVLKYFALGFGCCVAMFAVAAVTAFAVTRMGGNALSVARGDVTPTPLQMKEALEYLAANRPAQANQAQGGGSSGGGGAAAAEVTSTPGPPEAPRGGAGTPSVPSNSTTQATPQPTTTGGSTALPTPLPFTPPTIVPIQPLAPTPAAIQPAAPATSLPSQLIAPATSVPSQPQSTPSR